MIVTEAKYGKNFDNKNCGIVATIDGISMQVPLDAANRHYAAILEWVDAGNTIAAADQYGKEQQQLASQ